MEAPIIRIPDTEQNRRNISHPLLDSDGRIPIAKLPNSPAFSLDLKFHYQIFLGRLQLELVRRDKWMCITSVPDIVRSLRELFKASPPVRGTSQFDKIAHVQVRLARN